VEEIHNNNVGWNKSKNIAVLISIFLGPFTWLYTHRKDAWKASLGLGITVSLIIIWIITNISRVRYLAAKPPEVMYEGYEIIALIIFTLPVFFGIWLWAVIDTISKNRDWFNSGSLRRNKQTAVFLAIFVGPWTWLYTYNSDAWKFWLGIAIGYGSFLSIAITEVTYLMPIAIIESLMVWLFAIIESASRNNEFYETIGSRH